MIEILNLIHSFASELFNPLMTNERFYGLFNPSMTNVPRHIETSQLICIANQLTGLYILMNIGARGLEFRT